MYNDNVISTLNGLIETCKDGERGFKTAAEGLKDAQVKALFEEYSRQRGDMARQLQAEVRSLGGDPEKSGSIAGAAHRGWINIKSAVTGKDEASIIAEAERGEDSAKQMYEEALKEPLPASTLAILREQSAKVHAAHDRVRALEIATSE
jgi:uncharacterized protein (TIGR02284 family)